MSGPSNLENYEETIKAKTTEEEKFYLASQSELIWRKFKKHKLARISLPLLIFLYLLAIFADFFVPYNPETRFPAYLSIPPTRIHFFSEDGKLHRPFVYDLKKELDLETFQFAFTEDHSRSYPVRFFVRGEPYKLLGLFSTDIHFFGTEPGGSPIFLFGTDKLGRCLFSRTLCGARISLSIGLVGVFLSFVLGLILGGISGYFGGVVDEVIQRVIDFLISIPTIPLWMALSAAVPRNWSVIKTYFAITIILSLVGWCGLARVVRGKLLSLREEDFVMAARLAGASELRIVTRHLLPSFASHLIVSITLSIPGMILGETALSFLGLGMRPPAISWGVLLQDVQEVIVVAQRPWQLMPALFVIITVLLFNFLGDGLRDAVDPYAR